jgi:hypothetical protein
MKPTDPSSRTSPAVAGTDNAPLPKERRRFLKSSLGVAGAAASVSTFPFIRNAEAAKATTWKIQSTWDAGTTG